MSQHSRNIPSLDLLRSFAIATVVLAHSVLAFGAPAALAPLQMGGVGVDLFFLLSGWLLGRQLMQELRSSGRIGLTRFWTRRWLRTLPAYYAVLLFTFGQQVVLKGNYSLSWSYLFFGQNYLTNLPYLYVSWSLCVEEHFYLLIGPLLLLAFWLRRKGILLLSVVLLVPVVCRTAGWYGDLVETHVRFDECLVGVCLAGLSVFAPAIWKTLCRFAPWIAGIGLSIFAAMIWQRWHPEWSGWFPDEQTLCVFVFGSFILLAVSNDDWKQRLYVPGATYLAKRAYSVYLLHPEATALLRYADLSSFVVFFLLTWLLTLAGAEILYRLVEKPLMDARERLNVSRSTPPAQRTQEQSLTGRATRL